LNYLFIYLVLSSFLLPAEERKMLAFEQPTVFAPKVLCLLSHWPFYDGMKNFLQQLYRISVSPGVLPIERYIANFMNDVPVPRPGYAPVKYSIGSPPRPLASVITLFLNLLALS